MKKDQYTPDFPQKIFRDQLLTSNDLLQFKKELIFEFKQILKEAYGKPTKQWLKSQEVQKLLDISPNTLQSFRNKGIIPYTKIGGVVYYSYEDIQKMMEDKKFNAG